MTNAEARRMFLLAGVTAMDMLRATNITAVRLMIPWAGVEPTKGKTLDALESGVGMDGWRVCDQCP